MVKPLMNILGKVVDGVAGVVVSGNDMLEDVVDEIPVVGDVFVDKVWSPATALIGKVAYAPFKMLGLGKRY